MDSQKYVDVMHRIRGRIDYVNGIFSVAESGGNVSYFMVESICLQLRMSIEDIAVACIIANSSEMPELANKLRKEYRPSRILKSLEAINAECYPIPMVENVQGSHGRFRDTDIRPEGDWLTKDEASSEYGKLSNFIHQNLQTYGGHPVYEIATYEDTKNVATRICNLLSHHQITVLDENKMYRVIVPAGLDDKIQVAEFQRM